MASWLQADDVAAAKADEWLNQAKTKTQAWLTSFTGAASPMPDQQTEVPEPAPAMPQIKLPSAEELRALAPWRDLDPQPSPAQTPATLVDGRQQPQPRMRPGEQMGNVEISQGPKPQAPRPLAPVGNGQYGEIDNSSRQSFVRTAWPYMLDAAGGDTNLAELMLAKAISENGDVGKGGGFIGNNFSGIKGEGSAGSFEADTWEDYGNGRVNIRDRFAAYHTPQEGFRAFMAFLHNNERYAPALARYQQTGDASQLFRDIRAAGYATDPIWADKIENIRETQVAPIVRGQSSQDMQRLSLNAAQPLAPGGSAAPPAPAGVSSAPAGAPPAPWEMPGAQDGGQMMLKENDETAAMMGPGDGGFAPMSFEQPYDPDQGPREATPGSVGAQPLPQTDQNYPMTYGPIEQGEVQGPQAPPQSQIDRYVPSYAPQAAQVAPTMPSPAAGAVQSGIDAGVEAYNDPFFAAGPQPPRWVKIVSDAMQAFGSESAKNVARSLGVTDDEWFSVFGYPISRVDVAGFAGGMAADPTNYVGLNAADPLVTVARGAVRDFAPEAVKNVGRAVGGAVREGADALGRGLQGVGREVAAGLMDLSPVPRMIQESGGGMREIKPTVEVLQEQLDGMRALIQRARADGNTDLERRAIDRAWQLESALVDARNARLDLEPRITSDVGRRMDELPLTEESASDFAGIGRERVSPSAAADLTEPSAVATDMSGRMNSALPGFDPASAAAGGLVGSQAEGEDGEAGDPLRTAAAFLLAGVGGGMTPGARRALQKAMDNADALKAAGRADDAARVVEDALRRTVPGYEPRLSREPVLPGLEPPRRVPGDAGPSVSELPNRAPALGDVPPSAIDQRALPGMDPLRDVQARPLEEVVADVQIPESLNTPQLQRALTSAQRRAENMQRRGLATPSVWDWIKQAGYAGIYGPATFSNAVIGGAQELVGAQAKELTRAVASGRPGSYADQVGAQARAVPDSLAGLGRVLFGAGSEGAAAASGGSQGTANLSERVVNPVGHFVARMLERPGELLTEAPDAVFRPLFTAQGMAREARTIAAEAGMRGRRAAEYADGLMRAAEELRANPDAALASDEARRIVEAGTKHADELGYKGPSSSFGKKLGEWSKRDDAIGVIASFLAPFPAMAERMSRAAARSTPGAGLLPGIRRGQASAFDVAYDQAFGTAVAAGLAYWAFNGGITGSGPRDPEQRQMMIDQGWQPNSVLVGGYYVPNRVLGRFQPMLDTAGEIHDALAYGKGDGKPGELAADLVKRGTKIATNQIGLSGLADLNDMLTQGFASRFPGWVARSGVRYLPYGGVMRAAANATDESPRKPGGWGDVGLPEAIKQQAMTAVPGLRQRLPAAQDSLGRNAQNPQQGLGAIIPRVTTQRNDPVIRLFQDAGVDIGKPKDAVTYIDTPIDLTPERRRQWNTARGEYLIRVVTPLMQGGQLDRLPQERRAERLRDILNNAADAADRAVIRDIPPAERSQLRQQAIQTKKKAS